MTTLSTLAWPYRLTAGHSNDPARGACAMDAVNWLVHGKHGDQPKCACPVIGRFVIGGNDTMPADTRQQLLRYLHRIAGSRSAAHIDARLRIMILAAVRVFLPARLETSEIITFRHAGDRLRGIDDRAGYPEMLDAMPQGFMRLGWYSMAIEHGLKVLNPTERIALALTWASDLPTRPTRKRATDARYIAALCGEQPERLTNWSYWFTVLDAALNAGPQGEPWSADVAAEGLRRYATAGGKGTPVGALA